jgi:hypothetical protein
MRPYHFEEDEKKKVLATQLAPWLVPGHPPRNYAASPRLTLLVRLAGMGRPAW